MRLHIGEAQNIVVEKLYSEETAPNNLKIYYNEEVDGGCNVIIDLSYCVEAENGFIALSMAKKIRDKINIEGFRLKEFEIRQS